MALQDRRRYLRVRVDGSLEGRATVLTQFKVATLSEGGAALEMSFPLALGSSCELTLNLSHGSVDLKGRVVHVQEPETPGAPYRVGVRFVSVETLDKALLKTFLERELRKEA